MIFFSFNFKNFYTTERYTKNISH